MNPSLSLAGQGRLSAVGTAASPIAFTAATPGASGEWYSLQVGGGGSRLSYVTLEGGGANGGAALEVQGTALQADHLTIRNAGGDAISAYNAGGTSITACTLTDVAGNGASNGTSWSDEIAVTGCYWGAASGPYHPTLNPNGKGLAVSDGVKFTPWNPAYLVPGDGRLSGIRVASNNNTAQVQHFGYDRIGRLTSLSSSGYAAYTLAYTYDAAGQLLTRRRRPARAWPTATTTTRPAN